MYHQEHGSPKCASPHSSSAKYAPSTVTASAALRLYRDNQWKPQKYHQLLRPARPFSLGTTCSRWQGNTHSVGTRRNHVWVFFATLWCLSHLDVAPFSFETSTTWLHESTRALLALEASVSDQQTPKELVPDCRPAWNNTCCQSATSAILALVAELKLPSSCCWRVTRRPSRLPRHPPLLWSQVLPNPQRAGHIGQCSQRIKVSLPTRV